jgi:hypothetical protein
MRVMNIPGFTAEVSLNRTSAQYRMTVGKLAGTEASIFPQLRIVATGPGQKNGICASVGDLVNQAYQESIDPGNPASEQQAWRDLANEMYDRGKSNIGCSFGVAS